MIEIMQRSQGNLGVKLSQTATQEDYEKIFIPALNDLLAKSAKIRGVYYMDESFSGWELGAMWDDARYGLKHRNDFEKVAVVGGSKFVDWGTKLAGHLISGEVKTFSAVDLEEAWKWIEA
jgi:hypothetical protein